MRLTSTQNQVVKWIEGALQEENEKRRIRGEPATSKISKPSVESYANRRIGICERWKTIRIPTLYALQDLGLITVSTTQTTYETYRTGAYGRWIGGMNTHRQTNFTITLH